MSLIFLKNQHSFRHLSLGGRNTDYCDDLQLRILPRTVIDDLIKSQKEDAQLSGRSSKLTQDELVIEHYECCHKPLPEFSNIDTLSEVHHALGFLPEPSFKQVLLEEIVTNEDETSPAESG